MAALGVHLDFAPDMAGGAGNDLLLRLLPSFLPSFNCYPIVAPQRLIYLERLCEFGGHRNVTTVVTGKAVSERAEAPGLE